MARSLLQVYKDKHRPARGILADADAGEVLEERAGTQNKNIIQHVLSGIGGVAKGAAGTVGAVGQGVGTAVSNLPGQFENPSPMFAAGVGLLSGHTGTEALGFAQSVMMRRQQAQQMAQAAQARELMSSRIGQVNTLEEIDALLPDVVSMMALGIDGSDKMMAQLVTLRNQMQTSADKERDIQFRQSVEDRKLEEAAIDRMARGERDEAEHQRRLQLQNNTFAHQRAMAERAENARAAAAGVKPRSKAQIDAQVRADQYTSSIAIMEAYIAERGIPSTVSEKMFQAGGPLRGRVDDQTQAFYQAREAIQLLLANQLFGARVTPAARRAVIRTYLPSAGDSMTNVAQTLQGLRSFEMTLREFANGGVDEAAVLQALGVDPSMIGADDADDGNPFLEGY
jgi:hypothetical protein